jgi:hypothetical protein
MANVLDARLAALARQPARPLQTRPACSGAAHGYAPAPRLVLGLDHTWQSANHIPAAQGPIFMIKPARTRLIRRRPRVRARA